MRVVETLSETDKVTAVRAFIADVNLERRGLKKGQKAMALAMLYPKPKQGKKADPELLKKLEKLGTTRHAADQRLSQARAVLDHSAALAQDVMADRVPLDAALARVKDEQARASSPRWSRAGAIVISMVVVSAMGRIIGYSERFRKCRRYSSATSICRPSPPMPLALRHGHPRIASPLPPSCGSARPRLTPRPTRSMAAIC
jgi:hypothetical protein